MLIILFSRSTQPGQCLSTAFRSANYSIHNSFTYLVHPACISSHPTTTSRHPHIHGWWLWVVALVSATSHLMRCPLRETCHYHYSAQLFLWGLGLVDWGRTRQGASLNILPLTGELAWSLVSSSSQSSSYPPCALTSAGECWEWAFHHISWMHAWALLGATPS